jgi:hypothetical protein
VFPYVTRVVWEWPGNDGQTSGITEILSPTGAHLILILGGPAVTFRTRPFVCGFEFIQQVSIGIRDVNEPGILLELVTVVEGAIRV